MWFFYDSQGSRVGFVQGDNTYYYMYNVQGDVVGLVDAENGNVVAKYEYDAWGNCTGVTNATGSTVGTDNPFRYRGYYYDSETGYYYLNSRYYSPEFGRFINADSIVDNRGLNTQNLYAYCGNNPVNCNDISGNIPAWAITGLVGGFIGAVTGAISAATNGENVLLGAAVGFGTGFVTSVFCGKIGKTAIEFLKTGKIVSAGATVLGGMAGTGAIAGGGNAIKQRTEYKNRKANNDDSITNESFIEYFDKKEFIETVTTAALLAPAAIMVGAGVDKAFNNPTTLKAASDIAGYGVANLFMGGNVSLIQTIIDLF